MKLKEEIIKLRKAREEDKLVIFVGAGVSKNSGIPTWGELVKCFAKEIPYGKCRECNDRKSDCYTECPKDVYNFSQDEYLKIPQYFYSTDRSKEKSRYREIINKVLNIEAKPNPINNLIMALYPKHIITTNFDKLIENTQNPNLKMYKVITKDKELLTKISNNYIIKMHGDINNLKEVVLKESDYLTYQQNHILVEIFIKTLLMDHTFLFVGYSLNDYNLKLIISWIENIAKELKVGKNQRPKNFIISNMVIDDEYTEKYFSENNIFIISTSDIPKELKEKNLKIKLNDLGKDVYSVLDYILDSDNDFRVEPLADVLYDRYQIFKNQKRISFEDLISIYSFGNPDHLNRLLLFYDKSRFESLREILAANNKKVNFIKEILIKAGIDGIRHEANFQPVRDSYKGQNVYYKLIELEQSNNYIEILSMANDINDEMVRAYYFYFITDPVSENFVSCMEEVGRNLVDSEDYFKLLIFKYNMINIKKIQHQVNKEDRQDFRRMLNNIPKSYEATCLYLKKIYEDNVENIHRCNQLADQCEEIYTKKTNTIYLGNKYPDLFKLQAIAYDYYYYFKINNLMLDYFVNPKIFLEPYVRAMLCTYSPKKERKIDWFGFEPTLKEHKLNSIDFDIIIKHTDLEKLKLFVSDFNVQELIFEEDIKVEEKFINLCDSISSFPNSFLLAYLNNFLYILTKCHLDNSKVNIIFDAIFKLLFEKLEIKKILPDIFNELVNYMGFCMDENITILTKMLNRFLDIDIINYLKKHNSISLEYIYELLYKYSNEETQEKVSALIDDTEKVDEKIRIIYDLRVLFNEHQKSVYRTIIKNNLKLVNTDCLHYYLREKYLEYDEEIQKRFYDTLQGYADKRNEKPNAKTYPDLLTETINHLIILYLFNRIEIEDLKKFSCFDKYSETLDFLLNPVTFNYSKIKTENYMWENFMRNKKYLEIFKEHKSEILKNLKKSVDNGYATESQKILFYRYFLTEEEVSNYL
jgi:hypothetical protein